MRSTFISIIFLAAAISPALGAPAAMGSLNALARRSDLTPGDIDEGFIVPLVGGECIACLGCCTACSSVC